MTRRLPLAVAAALVLASTASASEKKADPGAERAVDVSAIGAPIVWKGRLVNYVFLSAKLKLAPGQELEKLRAKEPYFRDALVRAAHRTPFVDPSDLTRVDERALTAALMREAARIAGPRAFASAVVVSQQPRQRSGLPRTGAEPARGRPITP
jgi:hypothetical protein